MFIANFATIGMVDAERDDPTFSLEILACPQIASIAVALTDGWVEGLRESALCDLDEEGIDPNEGEWTVEHRAPQQGRENWTHRFVQGTETVAMVVIQRVETE